MPPLSAPKTEITKRLDQYSSVIVCVLVDTIILLILTRVWCLCACELVVINKNHIRYYL